MTDWNTDYNLPAHYADYLHVRSVTAEIAKERGYRYVAHQPPRSEGHKTPGLEVAHTFGFPPEASGLLMPLHPVTPPEAPEKREAWQIRLEDPEAFAAARGNARVRKFTTPHGQRNVLATAPRTRHLLVEPKQLCIVAEGITRVDALAAFDVPAVGILGAGSWKGGVPSRMLPDFDFIGIQGQRWLIALDGDVRTNRNVNAEAMKLQRALLARGALTVHVLALPPGLGLDDWMFQEHFPTTADLVQALAQYRITDEVQHVAAPRPAGATFDVDDAGPWSCTPMGDARRLMEFAPEQLCVVEPSNPAMPWRLMVQRKDSGGVWSDNGEAVGQIHAESALEWQRRVTQAVIDNKLKQDQASFCTKHAVTSARPQGVRDLQAVCGRTYLHMLDHNIIPPTLTVCKEKQLNADRYSLGAPNGVICLRKGELLPPEDARARFVTRTVPDPFARDASHDYARSLLAHLDDVDRTYIQQALGFALRGNPARRIYGLAGQKGGGKSTLLNAIIAAVGDARQNGYGLRLEVEALLASRWTAGKTTHHGNLMGLQSARIAVTEEPPIGHHFNVGLLKDLSGGLAQNFRDVGEKTTGSWPVTATIFIAMNPGQEDALDTTDDALADRVRLLRYPRLAVAVDVERIQAVAEDPKARQAVVALVVQWCAKTPHLPSDPPSVEEYTKERRRESMGELGAWLQDRVALTGDAKDAVNIDALWRTMQEALESADDKVCGKTRTEMLRMAREVYPDLPRITRTRRGSEWRGVKLLPFGDEADGAGPFGPPVPKIFQHPTRGPVEVPVAALLFDEAGFAQLDLFADDEAPTGTLHVVRYDGRMDWHWSPYASIADTRCVTCRRKLEGLKQGDGPSGGSDHPAQALVEDGLVNCDDDPDAEWETLQLQALYDSHAMERFAQRHLDALGGAYWVYSAAYRVLLEHEGSPGTPDWHALVTGTLAELDGVLLEQKAVTAQAAQGRWVKGLQRAFQGRLGLTDGGTA